MKMNGLKPAILGLSISLFTSCKMKAQNEGSGKQGHKPPTVDEIFEQLDNDEDGKISEKEVKGPLKNDFSKIDTNEDGFISKEELDKALKHKSYRT